MFVSGIIVNNERGIVRASHIAKRIKAGETDPRSALGFEVDACSKKPEKTNRPKIKFEFLVPCCYNVSNRSTVLFTKTN